jgi:hypothetical protein
MRHLKLFESFSSYDKIDAANLVVFSWAIEKYLDEDKFRLFIVHKDFKISNGRFTFGYLDKDFKSLSDQYSTCACFVRKELMLPWHEELERHEDDETYKKAKLIAAKRFVKKINQ